MTSTTNHNLRFVEVPCNDPHSPVLTDCMHLLNQYGAYMFDDLGLQDEKDSYYESLVGFPTSIYQRANGGAYFVAYCKSNIKDSEEYPLSESEIAVGIIGLRQYGPPEQKWCEMKRIFISPHYRNKGLGAALVEFILKEAVAMGYTQMWLDSDREMNSALRLYARYGFKFIENYNGNCNEGAVFMRLDKLV